MINPKIEKLLKLTEKLPKPGVTKFLSFTDPDDLAFIKSLVIAINDARYEIKRLATCDPEATEGVTTAILTAYMSGHEDGSAVLVDLEQNDDAPPAAPIAPASDCDPTSKVSGRRKAQIASQRVGRRATKVKKSTLP